MFLAVWILGGAYALIGASSMAELGALIPVAAGNTIFRAAELANMRDFWVGWSDWLSTCGTNAAVAIVIGEYSLGFVDHLMDTCPFYSIL